MPGGCGNETLECGARRLWRSYTSRNVAVTSTTLRSYQHTPTIPQHTHRHSDTHTEVLRDHTQTQRHTHGHTRTHTDTHRYTHRQHTGTHRHTHKHIHTSNPGSVACGCGSELFRPQPSFGHPHTVYFSAFIPPLSSLRWGVPED